MMNYWTLDPQQNKELEWKKEEISLWDPMVVAQSKEQELEMEFNPVLSQTDSENTIDKGMELDKIIEDKKMNTKTTWK